MNLVEDVVVVDFVFILGKACYQKQSEVAQSCPTLCNPMDCSLPGFSIRDFPGKSTGVGCHFLLQRIFPAQGLNPGCPHCRQMLYCLSHQKQRECQSRWFTMCTNISVRETVAVLKKMATDSLLFLSLRVWESTSPPLDLGWAVTTICRTNRGWKASIEARNPFQRLLLPFRMMAAWSRGMILGMERRSSKRWNLRGGINWW